MTKPNIFDVVYSRIDLRPAGREYRGLCPFHDDKTPSCFVNVEKQVFLCRACRASGDVIEFIMKMDGITFSEALRALGIDAEHKPRPPLTAGRRRAAERAAAWVSEQREKLNELIAERYEQRDLADELGDFDRAEIIDREIVMLRGFYDALKYPRSAAEMLAARETLEQITANVEIVYAPPAALPPLTPEYRARLKDNPLDFSECFKR